MNAIDAEIQIAILVSVERQANATAAALQRVIDLARQSVDVLGPKDVKKEGLGDE